MKEKPEKEEKSSKYREFFQTERGKAVLFFAFYVIFFIVIAILFRTSRPDSHLKTEKEQLLNEVNYQYKLDLLENENYHYKYLITIGTNISLYEGDHLKNQEMFQMIGKDASKRYFREGSLFVEEVNGQWIQTENPYQLKEFYDVEKIKTLLEKATFVSKTEYQNGKNELKFSLTTEEIKNIFKENFIGNSSENEIIVRLDENKNIVGLLYNIENYYLQKEKVDTDVHIEITYTNFGKIKEIEGP